MTIFLEQLALDQASAAKEAMEEARARLEASTGGEDTKKLIVALEEAPFTCGYQ